MTPELNFSLTQGLKLIGLKDSVYWLTWQVGNLCLYAYGPNIWYCHSLPRAVTGLVIAFLSTLVLMVTGMYYTTVIEEVNVILLNSVYVCMYISSLSLHKAMPVSYSFSSILNQTSSSVRV